MKKVAIIGAGVSGLTAARVLSERYEVTLYEKDARPGGLIKCERVEGNLYHMVGGHVFNSKRQDVLNYFWSLFDKESEFVQAVRNACIFLDKPIGYPIENHLYQIESDKVLSIIDDLLKLAHDKRKPMNFEEFLKQRFGETLYLIYFKPYNEKIWGRPLREIPITWLAGKLPMPTVKEILHANIKNEKETEMVHSSFFYPMKNGSQFLVDRLSQGLTIKCNKDIDSITYDENAEKWKVNGGEGFDFLIYAGNLKYLPRILDKSSGIGAYGDEIDRLEYHGTTSVLCSVQPNEYSWVYLPDSKIAAHRIINTGNFAESNNAQGIKTATLEFTNHIQKDDILENLQQCPFSPRYIAHRYTEYTYPIQHPDTRDLINRIKNAIATKKMFLLGRFAEWEYYNMDTAMGAAMDLAKKIVE